MKRFVLILFLMLSVVCKASDVVNTSTVVKDCLYTVKFDDWVSTNKENGSMSFKKYVFQGELGDTLKFDWKTSTEEYCDKLVVSIDGEYVLTKSGEYSGTYKYPISSTGDHVVEFIYAKDYFSSSGDDEVKISNVRVETFGDAQSIQEYNVTNEFNGWHFEYINGKRYMTGNGTTYSIDVLSSEGDTFTFSYNIVSDEYDAYCQLKFSIDEVCYLDLVHTGEPDDNCHGTKCVVYSLPEGEHRMDLFRIGFYHWRSNGYSYGGSNVQCGYFLSNLCFAHELAPVKSKLSVCDEVLQIRHKATIHDFEYIRTYNNTKWQSFYVPFSMSYDDWKDDFEVAKINDINMYDTDGEIDETELEIIMIKKGTLKPNHPYLIKAKTPGEKTIKLTDVVLYAKKDTVDVSSAEMKYTFTGTLEGVTGDEMVNNKYYAMSGGALAYTEDTNASLKPFRWYMKAERRDGQIIMPTANNSRIRIKVFGEDGESTGVEELTAEENVVESNVVYSIDGRVASRNGAEGLRPGIYISKGKKVFVK